MISLNLMITLLPACTLGQRAYKVLVVWVITRGKLYPMGWASNVWWIVVFLITLRRNE